MILNFNYWFYKQWWLCTGCKLLVTGPQHHTFPYCFQKVSNLIWMFSDLLKYHSYRGEIQTNTHGHRYESSTPILFMYDSDSCIVSPALLRTCRLELDPCRTQPCRHHGYASAEFWFPIQRLPWKNITHLPDKTNTSTTVRRPDKNLIIYPLFNMWIQYSCLHSSYL